MRIQLFSTNYIPEKNGMAPFSTGICEYLAGRGHEVTAVTAFPYYPAWRVWDGYRGRLFQKEQINGVTVRRVWHFVPRRPSNLLQRLAHDLTFTLSVFLGALFAGGSNVICCVCPPPTLAFAAYLLAKIRRRPYIIILADLASDAAMATGIMKDGPIVRLARSIEGFAYRNADKTVCICHGFVESLTANGIPAEKLALIPLWGDTENVYPTADASKFRAANEVAEHQFLIMHTGNMGKKQDLMNVVRAAELLKERTDVLWFLIGHGEERLVLDQYIREQKLTNVKLLPLQPAEELAEMYCAADVLVLNQRAAVVDSVIPSKLLTYMAAGRPVVAAVSDQSETSRYIDRAKCGVIVQPESPAALAEAVLNLKQACDLRHNLGANGRTYVEENFTKQKILREYEVLLSRYADGMKPGAEATKSPLAAN
jgi:colanic acid biosynthesis glycosyl transferase WcaI